MGKDFDSATAMPGRELVAAVAAEVVNVLKRSHEEGNAAEVRWDATDTGSPRTRQYVSKAILLFFDARGRVLTK